VGRSAASADRLARLDGSGDVVLAQRGSEFVFGVSAQLRRVHGAELARVQRDERETLQNKGTWAT
jgi:hypothetical protein